MIFCCCYLKKKESECIDSMIDVLRYSKCDWKRIQWLSTHFKWIRFLLYCKLCIKMIKLIELIDLACVFLVSP